MKPTRTREYQDTEVNVKIVLSGLWISMLFLFAYVDIFAFWRADVINGALVGEVPGQGVSINQAFLAMATGYVLIPILMIVVSLLARPSVNRLLNVGVSIVYAISIAALSIGEEWVYYLLGSFFEVLFLLAIARIAWKWPINSVRPRAEHESETVSTTSTGPPLSVSE